MQSGGDVCGSVGESVHHNHHISRTEILNAYIVFIQGISENSPGTIEFPPPGKIHALLYGKLVTK